VVSVQPQKKGTTGGECQKQKPLFNYVSNFN
jgi:hypothetical protein